jgi:hypothetical protein
MTVWQEVRQEAPADIIFDAENREIEALCQHAAAAGL